MLHRLELKSMGASQHRAAAPMTGARFRAQPHPVLPRCDASTVGANLGNQPQGCACVAEPVARDLIPQIACSNSYALRSAQPQQTLVQCSCTARRFTNPPLMTTPSPDGALVSRRSAFQARRHWRDTRSCEGMALAAFVVVSTRLGYQPKRTNGARLPCRTSARRSTAPTSTCSTLPHCGISITRQTIAGHRIPLRPPHCFPL